jgi:protein gp37
VSKETSISWTDHTFNPWWGCMKVSPGCANCYAEAFAKRTGHDVWGPTAEYRTFGKEHWAEPLAWNASAAKRGVTERVFCASMADVFDERGPNSERRRLFELIRCTRNLTWQLLTKRPENWAIYFSENMPNVWLGFTAENQEYFDERSRCMRHIPGFTGKFFVSYEPALGPIRLVEPDPRLEWLIFGGETGGKRRPMEQQWAEDIKTDCDRLGIAFFMKQMSAATPAKASALIPANLLRREFPR